MKKKIGERKVRVFDKRLQKYRVGYESIWEIMRPKPPDGNEIDITDIPPLDAEVNIWKNNMVGKERK